MYFEINDEGMINYKTEQKAETIKYEESILRNHAQLSYQEADKLLNNVDITKDLPNKEQLKEDLKTLQHLMTQRRNFREKHISTDVKGDSKKKKANVEVKSESEKIVEELMLISHTILPIFIQRSLDESKDYLKEVQDLQKEVKQEEQKARKEM